MSLCRFHFRLLLLKNRLCKFKHFIIYKHFKGNNEAFICYSDRIADSRFL